MHNMGAITKQTVFNFLEKDLPWQPSNAKTSSMPAQMPGAPTTFNRDFEQTVLQMMDMQHQIGSLAKAQARLAHDVTEAFSELAIF